MNPIVIETFSKVSLKPKFNIGPIVMNTVLTSETVKTTWLTNTTGPTTTLQEMTKSKADTLLLVT